MRRVRVRDRLAPARLPAAVAVDVTAVVRVPALGRRPGVHGRPATVAPLTSYVPPVRSPRRASHRSSSRSSPNRSCACCSYAPLGWQFVHASAYPSARHVLRVAPVAITSAVGRGAGARDPVVRVAPVAVQVLVPVAQVASGSPPTCMAVGAVGRVVAGDVRAGVVDDRRDARRVPRPHRAAVSAVPYLYTPVDAATVPACTPMFALVLFVAWVVLTWQVLLQLLEHVARRGPCDRRPSAGVAALSEIQVCVVPVERRIRRRIAVAGVARRRRSRSGAGGRPCSAARPRRCGSPSGVFVLWLQNDRRRVAGLAETR